MKERFYSFLSRRLLEIRAIFFAGLGFVWALSLLSYHVFDPSFNAAVDGKVFNVMGPFGAHVASIWMPFSGYSTLWLCGVFFRIAWCCWNKRTLERFRLSLFFLGWILWVALFALYPSTTGHLGPLIRDALTITPSSFFEGTVVWCVGVVVSFFFMGGFLGFYQPMLWVGRTVLFYGKKVAYAMAHKMNPWVLWPFLHAKILAFFKKEQGLNKNPVGTFDIPGGNGQLAGALQKTQTLSDALLPEPPSGEFSDKRPEKKGGVGLPVVKTSSFFLPSNTPSPQETEEKNLPPLDLLKVPRATKDGLRVSKEELVKKSRQLLKVLRDFGILGEILSIRPGPVVTLYELQPAAGLKSSRVISLSDDIARSMSAVAARVAVIPGRNVIGIELPNPQRETVYLKDLFASNAYEKSPHYLSLVLGKDIGGTPVMVDLARMPHLLVAGTTGSGKSVGLNAMILSLVFRLPPSRCKFIMIDPKMLELSVYDGIGHLLTPVVTDPKKAVTALKWVVREMENRYRLMARLGVRNIEGYNKKLLQAIEKKEKLTHRLHVGFDDQGQPLFEEQDIPSSPLPFIVVVVDEMADLMLVAGKDIEIAVQRLAQMARAAGIHLIMATQRPSVDVITGTIKANFPTRISFQVTSKIDSRTILGEQGAEQLLGQGDMLYMASGGRVVRVHAPFVSDQDVENVVSFLKKQSSPNYLDDITCDDESLGEGMVGNEADDPLYQKAVDIVRGSQKSSTSYVQRQLQIGYNRAARLMESMEKKGVVSAPDHKGKRQILGA